MEWELQVRLRSEASVLEDCTSINVTLQLREDEETFIDRGNIPGYSNNAGEKRRNEKN